MMSNEEVKIRNLQQEVERLKTEVQELSAPDVDKHRRRAFRIIEFALVAMVLGAALLLIHGMINAKAWEVVVAIIWMLLCMGFARVSIE